METNRESRADVNSMGKGRNAGDAPTLNSTDISDRQTVVVTLSGANNEPEVSVDIDAAFNTGNVRVCENDPNASDSLGFSALDAGAAFDQVSDNLDGAFTRDPDGQVKHLIDG